MRVTSADILTGDIGAVIRKMTAPMVVGIAAMMAFQAVDVFFISMLGTTELAAISFTFPVTFTVFSSIIGLSIAVSILVGQAIGRGNHEAAAVITTDSLVFSSLLVLLISAIGLYTIDSLFTLLGASESAIVLIHEYMDIWYSYVVFMVIPMLANSALRATGDTKWPSILMILGGLVNVVLDPIFIFGFGPIQAMGIAGAAYATLVSWLVTFVGGLWLLYVREGLIRLELPALSQLLVSWGNLLKLGAPISAANMLNPVVMAVLTALTARHGEQAVAAFGAGSRVEAFGLVIAMALTSALSPYMAQNIGAGNRLRAHDACMLCCRFIAKYQVVVWLAMMAFAEPLARLFSDDEKVIEIAVWYLRVMPAGACFYAVSIVLNTAYNANQDSAKTLIVALCRLLAFVGPCAWLGNELAGLLGIFVGAVVGNKLSVVLSYWLYSSSNYNPAKEV